MTTSARTGRTLLLRDGLLGGSTAIAAMRTTSFRVAGATVDVTDKDSSGQYRELLAGAGVVSLSITATGLLHGNAQATTLLSRCLARSADDYRIEFDNGDYITGKFQISNFEAAGEYDREQTYALTLESASALTLATA